MQISREKVLSSIVLLLTLMGHEMVFIIFDFFYIGVIVYPLSTMTLWRNDTLTPILNIELGLNAINGYHSAIGIYYHMLK